MHALRARSPATDRGFWNGERTLAQWGTEQPVIVFWEIDPALPNSCAELNMGSTNMRARSGQQRAREEEETPADQRANRKRDLVVRALSPSLSFLHQ